jgi:hypothetical protein
MITESMRIQAKRNGQEIERMYNARLAESKRKEIAEYKVDIANHIKIGAISIANGMKSYILEKYGVAL